MAEEDNLKLFWEHFFKAETGTYEKSTWLDLFLAEFLIRVKAGAKPKELINFCPISGVVSLVGCELLCGIHRVTSSINAHYAMPLACLEGPVCAPSGTQQEASSAPEDPRPQATSLFSRTNAQSSADILRKYLLGTVAWRCLELLKVLGVEGLSCCRQLSSVLIWLYGEVGGGASVGGGACPPTPARPRSPAPPAESTPKTPIQHLFSNKIWSKQKQASNQGSKNNSGASSEKSSTAGRPRRISQIRQESADRSKRKFSKPVDQSTESADSNEDLQILNKSLTTKVCNTNDDFEYFNSPVRTTDFPHEPLYADPYYVPKKPKPKADDYTNEKHKEIINSEISTYEFTMLIIDLLQELCKAESSLSGTEGSQISVQCINFSLRNLCSLQFSSLPSQTQDNEQVSQIKVALTELLIVSLDKVLIHHDLCSKLINNGILPMLLRVLEDVICKISVKYNKDEQNRAKTDIPVMKCKTESENLLKFVFGIAYSITAFFHCLLMQCRTIDKLREFTDQFKLYGECLKGGLLKECIELMVRIDVDDDKKVVLIKKLLESIGRLISGMRRVRSEVVHSAACNKSKHRVCRARLASGAPHHHRLLGEPAPGLPLSSTCCISLLYGTLTSLLTDEQVSSRTILRNKILKVMLNSGVCCCFSPGFLMESIVRLMLTYSTAAPLCLQLLEHTVYGDLGASVLIPKVTDQLPCSVCEPCEDKRDLIRKYCPHGVSPIERKSVWSFLIHYNSLLQLDNHNNVLHATVSHLLRVTPKCRTAMKQELLFSVIYPTFIVAKHRYMIRLEESAYFLTVSCLNIFASLLNTVSFAEQFIQKGGLSYVLELVSLSEFSNQCCSILEIAIIVEIFKLMKDNSDITFFREINSLSSVQMLFKSLSEMTDKCYKIYKIKMPLEIFEELCDLTKEREILNFTSTNQMERTRRVSVPKSIRSTFEMSDNVIENAIEDYVEILKTIWTFWKSCAALCLYSPMFREFVASEDVFVDSYALLKLILYYLCHSDCSAGEMKVIIKIAEALLTVQFAVSDVTSGRSKDAACLVLRAALPDRSAPLEGSGGASLRALCEALIRVAVARPSNVHSMPRLTTAKLPPLGCESTSSSVEGSSSEESTPGLYASDVSEPMSSRADDGYDADVEVGKLDVTSMHKPRKISTNSNISNLTDPPYPKPEALTMECAEYTKNGELAHPELCNIVVDILIQLVNTCVSCGLPGGGPSGAVAAGWLARLRAALRAARAAPPLLARLAGAAGAAAQGGAHLTELQQNILELIHVVASQSISPEELAALLRLAAQPPLLAPLAALRRLAEDQGHNTPDDILTFPTMPVLEAENKAALYEELNYVMVNSTTSSQSHQAEAFAKKLKDAHTKAGVASCWAGSAAWVGAEGAGWAPWLQGFALACWISATHPRADADRTTEPEDWSSDSAPSPEKSPHKEMPAKPAGYSHVVSVGHDSLMFEVWLDTGTGRILFRLSRPEIGSNRVISEASVAAGVSHKWTCLAVNVRETMHKRKIHIQVTLYVNGCECETVSLPLQGILVRKVTPTVVLLGAAHSGDAAVTSLAAYHVSHAMLYRAPCLTWPRALHLAAHAPHSACQVRCQAPNYAPLLTPDLINSNLDWDQVYEMSSTSIREMHDNVLLSFSASSPNIINLYHQTVATPNVFSSRSSTTHSGSVPEALTMRWLSPALASRRAALAPALIRLGGAGLLLYLAARVVELDGSAEEQAMAVSVVLKVCASDPRLYAELYGDDKIHLLHTVFAADKCIMSHHLLRVILEAACSTPVLTYNGSSLVVRGPAVLSEPRLLLLLARIADQLQQGEHVTWEVEAPDGSRSTLQGSLWALTLSCMSVLLQGAAQDEHTTAFNYYQMTRVGMLRHLFTVCKERFLNSSLGPLEPSLSSLVVCVVRRLLGAPPWLDRLALLVDFLLLMHQASDTFVTHSRANFYFLLTPETADQSDFTTLKRRPSKRNRKRGGDVTDPPSSASVTSDDNDKEGRDRLDSVDSAKHLKGIINMQIKEGRKHNVSSTSENSDIVGQENTGSIERLPTDDTTVEPEQQEKESGKEDYIIVDEDDVKHTTVEVYTSGIYHQRRVRAGADPEWTACEGLLELLKDAINMLPDHMLAQAILGPVNAEVVCVLCKHPLGGVRAGLARALAALAARVALTSSPHYYVHCAHQLSLYPGTWELGAACAELLTKCDVPLEDQLDDEIWSDIGEDALQRAPPLLALLPACLRVVPLAHNLTLIVRRIIDKGSLKTLSDIAVPEVVVRCVRSIGQMGEADFEGRELLLDDLQELLRRMASKAIASPHSMQFIIDVHHLLSYVELTADSDAVCRVAQLVQARLYCDELEQLHTRMNTHTEQKYHNYFTTVLSSAVSLGSESWSRAERSELAARHLNTTRRALTFLLSHSPGSAAPDLAPLAVTLQDSLVPALWGGGGGGGGGGSSNARAQSGRWWWGAGEYLPLAQELVWWTMMTSQRARLLAALYRGPHEPKINQPRKLAVYLLMMLKHIHAAAEEGLPTLELAITDWARDWALSLQAGLPDRLPSDTLHYEADNFLKADEERWTKAAYKLRPAIAKVVFSKEQLAQKVTETAMSMTRCVVDIQNGIRKAFMEHLRRRQSDLVSATVRWKTIIEQHTHQQAVWHDPARRPASWRLDATETAGRVRARLTPHHLRIPPRFLKPHAQYKAEERLEPLASVVGATSGGLMGGLVARLQLHETVWHMARVTYLTVHCETTGELLLTDRCIHFVPEDVEEKIVVNKKGEVQRQERADAQSWPLEAVVQVATRRWCLQEHAVELFLRSGHAHLVAFADVNERTAFLKALGQCHLPNRTEPDTLNEAMTQWRNGTITNWEYLMRLNGLAGRTYNDLMQYPVLPFIIADYTSRILDLNDPKSFRDLSKPMAVQNKSREQHYINTYNDLASARRLGCSPLVSREPHHYASLYSNSGGVLHYLVRVPPFTELFLNYQDNNFDMPDRTFHSLATTWRLITQDSPTDVKELIPELFYLPELFHNVEGLELGVRQCGAAIDDVELPPWAADARLFTLVHRQALEAAPVADCLPHWLDLVFGYKQTGPAAVQALNVFPHCTYYGFSPTSLSDKLEREAAAAMVRTYGQAPRQLLKTPHPHRAPAPLAGHDSARKQPEVWGGVSGAMWGRYCGSPARGPPVPLLRRAGLPSRVHALLPARTAALAACNTALVAMQDESEGPQGSLALLSWGHSDNIVRLKRRRDQRPDMVIMLLAGEQITAVSTWCGSPGTYVAALGMSSGRVAVVRGAGGAGGGARVRWLSAHRGAGGAVAAAHLSGGLLVTAGRGGLVLLWDRNQLTYIRTIPNRDMLPINHVTVSDTLLDIATVHEPARRHSPTPADSPTLADNTPTPLADFADSDSYEKDDTYKYKSLIRVHTVNARYVGSVKVMDVVTCICYSNAPEGVSVNCIVAGVRGGGVRLYSSWDLRPVATVAPAGGGPLISVAYSSDSSLIFGCYADGTAVAWESEGGAGAPVRLLPAHALF